MQLSRWIPKGSTKIADKSSTAVCYLKEEKRANGASYIHVVGYDGRKQKPAFNYTYGSMKSAEGAIQRYFEACQSADAYRAKRQAERKKPHSLKVGDVLTGSWGYDQTNVEAYQVVEVVGDRTVKIQKISFQALDDPSGYDSQYVKPAPGKFVGNEVLTRRASADNYVRLNDVCGLSPWDGGRMYSSWYH